MVEAIGGSRLKWGDWVFPLIWDELRCLRFERERGCGALLPWLWRSAWIGGDVGCANRLLVGEGVEVGILSRRWVGKIGGWWHLVGCWGY